MSKQYPVDSIGTLSELSLTQLNKATNPHTYLAIDYTKLSSVTPTQNRFEQERPGIELVTGSGRGNLNVLNESAGESRSLSRRFGSEVLDREKAGSTSPLFPVKSRS